MPIPEHGGNPEPPEHQSQQEAEILPYLRAARFPTEARSNRAYTRAQYALYHTPESDVSVYRVRLDRDWFVAALGQLPPPDLDDQLDAIFATGEPASLPAEVVAALRERRAHATRLGSWVERHQRPLPP
jgi:hypothetical protein